MTLESPKSPQSLESLDPVILETITPDFTKTAVLISKTYDACLAAGIEPSETLAKDIADRLYILIDNGRIEAEGNMRRWRDSEVRIITK